MAPQSHEEPFSHKAARRTRSTPVYTPLGMLSLGSPLIYPNLLNYRLDDLHEVQPAVRRRGTSPVSGVTGSLQRRATPMAMTRCWVKTPPQEEAIAWKRRSSLQGNRERSIPGLKHQTFTDEGPTTPTHEWSHAGSMPPPQEEEAPTRSRWTSPDTRTVPPQEEDATGVGATKSLYAGVAEVFGK